MVLAQIVTLIIGKEGKLGHPEFRLAGEDGESKWKPTFLTLTSAECYFLEDQEK